MKVIAVTHKGLQKQVNEDRIIIGETILSDGVFEGQLTEGVLAVADGVGGHKAGAVASQFVAEGICRWETVSEDRFYDLNDQLLARSQADPDLSGMATTLSGLCLGSSKAQLFSVGNTRIWQLQSGKYLKQLTHDDTVLQYLLDAGQLTEAEAETFDRKNEITACFGGGSPLFFSIAVQETKLPPAPILITSDGIHDHLSVDNMEMILEELGLTGDACCAMIAAAWQTGSTDDTSILLAIP